MARPKPAMRVAVTGAGGKLGQALLSALQAAPFVEETLAWDLPEHDLDDPASAERLVSAALPQVVVHTAAWTDVDACARNPELATRRNGLATGEMARACAGRGIALLAMSTNEVFDGSRTDGQPYLPGDRPHPPNPYGRAKLAGEIEARRAYGIGAEDAAWTAPLALVRTSWLFGPPGSDFPLKILAAARAAVAEGRTLDLVADEVGCPTYAQDLAAALVGLLESAAQTGTGALAGIHHLVGAGSASRAEWAREVLRLAGLEVLTRDVRLSDWPRPSTPPRWGVLAATPLPGGPLRDWRTALHEYLATCTEAQNGKER
jgi:dTDP-4-dehydrorhamnose reductase